jgi:hypothetical protein
MLRQGFMNKYKVKSKYDNERFQKEDEGYLLKLTRPVKESSIKVLSKEKMNKFMEDVLTNKKMTTILYDSNAQIEIKTSLKLIKNFRKQNERYTNNQKEEFEPVSVVKRRSRKEAYVQMRTEIDNYSSNKEQYKQNLLMKNYRKYFEMKKDLASSKNEYINYLRNNRINSFKRAYDHLKLKIDDNLGRTLETEYSSNQSINDKILENYYLFRNNYIDCSHTINLPNIKCDINNVFSRLYNNKVLLTLNEKKDAKKSKSRKAISLNRHLHNNKNKKSVFLSTRKLAQQNPKVKLNLKNVFKSNGGKEFTIKVTNEMFKKCLDKYSGGPETIKFLNNEFSRNVKTSNNVNNVNTDGFVNFYELTEKNTGNSYLHLAILGDYPELVKYFIEKGADINKKNNEGDTPLHIAVRSKNNKIIKILLENKAKLDIPNNEGEIPFDFFNNDMKKQYGLDKMLIINPTKNN